MVNVYPKAELRLLGRQTEPRMARYDIVCLHTMVGSLPGTDAYFRSGNGPGYEGTEAHIGIGGYGEVWQFQDLDYQADANGDGNHRIVSVETADKGAPFTLWSGSNVPPWTAAQVEAIAQFLAWAHKKWGIPLELVPDSRSDRRGIAYHRQGIDGNYPDRRKPGCEKWSTSFGKVCPGQARIDQVPRVIARAREIAAGKRTFRVKVGATLATIAAVLGVALSQLTGLNPTIDPAATLSPSATIAAPADVPDGDGTVVEPITPAPPPPAPPSTTPPSTSTPTAGAYVEYGTRGKAAGDLQRLLNAKGFKVTVDNSAGRETIGALKAAQAAAGIKVDGRYGPVSQAKIAALPNATPITLHRVLKRGAQGADVAALQRMIGAKVDGDFGPQTERKLRAYQRNRHLIDDAKAGPQVASSFGWAWRP